MERNHRRHQHGRLQEPMHLDAAIGRRGAHQLIDCSPAASGTVGEVEMAGQKQHIFFCVSVCRTESLTQSTLNDDRT
jgi:hypothetical protein